VCIAWTARARRVLHKGSPTSGRRWHSTSPPTARVAGERAQQSHPEQSTDFKRLPDPDLGDEAEAATFSSFVDVSLPGAFQPWRHGNAILAVLLTATPDQLAGIQARSTPTRSSSARDVDAL
jgi:hypothetical protein